MFVANACLRGAGDTLTPAITMIVVDIVNIVFSWGWTYGMFGLSKWGFEGIAAGTVVAYIAGGVIQVIVLLVGRGGIRLYLHRLRPHWHNLKRILRIGIPSGIGDALQWSANFALLVVVNRMDKTLVSSAAHNNTIKIESISYLAGFAFATAAATMVGQSLGMKDPNRATRSAYLAYAIGGGLMALAGIFFITGGRYAAGWLSDDPQVIALTTRCLFITGFCQAFFAAYMIFAGGLRGAGDTLTVMMLNLTSILGVRLLGGIAVGVWLHMGLAAIWMVLAIELGVRGSLIYGRFLQGGWRKVEV
jgi:putative MATE family efflux protein